MPMYGPRYHMNPGMGRALEEARATHEAGAATGDTAKGKQNGGPARDGHGRFSSAGPVHRVEIQSANGGFIASVHREPAVEAASASGQGIHASGAITPHGALAGVMDDQTHSATQNSALAHLPAGAPSNGMAEHPEVHVFTTNHDLVDFLRTELDRH